MSDIKLNYCGYKLEAIVYADSQEEAMELASAVLKAVHRPAEMPIYELCGSVGRTSAY